MILACKIQCISTASYWLLLCVVHGYRILHLMQACHLQSTQWPPKQELYYIHFFKCPILLLYSHFTNLPNPATQCVAIQGNFSPGFFSSSSVCCAWLLNLASINWSHASTIGAGGASPSANTKSCTWICFSFNGSFG